MAVAAALDSASTIDGDNVRIPEQSAQQIDSLSTSLSLTSSAVWAVWTVYVYIYLLRRCSRTSTATSSGNGWFDLSTGSALFLSLSLCVHTRTINKRGTTSCLTSWLRWTVNRSVYEQTFAIHKHPSIFAASIDWDLSDTRSPSPFYIVLFATKPGTYQFYAVGFHRRFIHLITRCRKSANQMKRTLARFPLWNLIIRHWTVQTEVNSFNSSTE